MTSRRPSKKLRYCTRWWREPARRLRRLPSNNHLHRVDEPGMGMFVDEVERFIAA
jgi:hypothetical protein